jgi:hypothetical protein
LNAANNLKFKTFFIPLAHYPLPIAHCPHHSTHILSNPECTLNRSPHKNPIRVIPNSFATDTAKLLGAETAHTTLLFSTTQTLALVLLAIGVFIYFSWWLVVGGWWLVVGGWLLVVASLFSLSPPSPVRLTLTAEALSPLSSSPHLLQADNCVIIRYTFKRSLSFI